MMKPKNGLISEVDYLTQAVQIAKTKGTGYT